MAQLDDFLAEARVGIGDQDGVTRGAAEAAPFRYRRFASGAEQILWDARRAEEIVA